MRASLLVSRRTALIALASLAVPLPAVACTRSDAAVDPVWGKEPCAHCRMLVGDKRYAAQVVARGDRHYFDDIGCMVLWLDGREPPERAWVRDAAAPAWLDAHAARYVAGARTPMDFGFEGRAAAAGSISYEAMRDAVMAKKRSTP